MSHEPSVRLLEELVRRVVSAAHPLRIILFGSAANGTMGPDSDLDVLVVVPNGSHRRQTSRKIYHALAGFGFATDIVVATEEDIQTFGTNPSLIYREALEHGRKLYDVAA